MVVVMALEVDFLNLFAAYCMRFGGVGFDVLDGFRWITWVV